MKNVSQGEGRTVLFVSHNLNSVKTLCDKSIILDKGSVSFKGTSLEGVKRYLKGTKNINSKNSEKISIQKENLSVHINKISLKNHLNENKAFFNNNEKFYIEINMGIESKNNMGIVLQFKDSDDNFLFVSAMSIEKSQFSFSKFTCELPDFYFNEGLFHVNILLSQLNKVFFLKENILSFEIRMTFDNNNTWFGKTKGPLKPKLKWHIS